MFCQCSFRLGSVLKLIDATTVLFGSVYVEPGGCDVIGYADETLYNIPTLGTCHCNAIG